MNAPPSVFARIVRGVSVVYLVALLIVTCALRVVGDDWWLTGVALYFPRVLFGLPCGVIALALVACGMQRWLWTQLLAAGVVLFPLMGLTLPSFTQQDAGTQLRVLSYNVNSCHAGQSALAARIARHQPDIVLLQELCADRSELEALLAAGYKTVHSEDQFLLATRFALDSASHVEGFHFEGRDRTARSMRYELSGEVGKLAVYNLHPVSPRQAFYAVRHPGVRSALREGTWQALLRGGNAEQVLRSNYAARPMQLSAAVSAAEREAIPTILAGDTNLPALSPVAARTFAAFQDGFLAVGSGFGYTYPRKLPWLRIDRIFANDALRFARFAVDCAETSDHCAVVADLTLAPAR